MEITNCTIEDISIMQEYYDLARGFQKEKSTWHWLTFDNAMLEKEIEERRQWKIVEDGMIACIYMTLYEDPYIWGERNNNPSIYIHRIVTHPDFRGKNYTVKIIEWAKEQAKILNKHFIRIDTWGENIKLRDYYVKCGFTYLETITPQSTENLPSHYTCISLSLLEIKVEV